MGQTIDIISLSSCGYLVQLRFLPAENHFFADLFKQAINQYLSPLTIKEKDNRKPDLIIEVEENQRTAHYTQKVGRRGLDKVRYQELIQVHKDKLCINYNLSLPQFLMVLNYAVRSLLKGEGFKMHASVAINNEYAYLFSGNQGVGKSSVVGLLQPEFTPLADDSCYLKLVKGRFWVYQTAMFEKNWLPRTPVGYPVKAVFFLRQSPETAIQLVTKSRTLSSLVNRQLIEIPAHLPSLAVPLSLFYQQPFFYHLNFSLNSKKLKAALASQSF